MNEEGIHSTEVPLETTPLSPSPVQIPRRRGRPPKRIVREESVEIEALTEMNRDQGECSLVEIDADFLMVFILNWSVFYVLSIYVLISCFCSEYDTGDSVLPAKTSTTHGLRTRTGLLSP